MSVLGPPARAPLMPVTCEFPEDADHGVARTSRSLLDGVGRSESPQKLLDDDQGEESHGAGKFTWKAAWAGVEHRGRRASWGRRPLCGDRGFLKWTESAGGRPPSAGSARTAAVTCGDANPAGRALSASTLLP